MMLWANANAEAIVRQIFPDAPEQFRMKIKWFPVVGRHENQPPTQVDMMIHAVLTEPEYLIIQTDDPEAPMKIRQDKELFNKSICLMFYQFILSIAATIKELKALSDTYEYNSTWAVVSGDSTHAALLEQQDIHFIKAPPEAIR